MTQRPVALSILLVTLAAAALPAAAQLVSIKTVPIAQGDQFELYPSNNFGMGSVTIALPDTLLDPFVNPAKGGRVGAAHFFSAPTFYSISHGAGGGRTLPLATIARSGTWFGALSLAFQEVDASPPVTTSFPPPPCIQCVRLAGEVTPVPAPATAPPRPDSYGNQYAQVAVGKKIPGGVSVAGSIAWARLTGVDGVDLLYAGSAGLKQFGHWLDVRLGLLKEWEPDRSFEALVLHNRFGMKHDVTYLDPFWDPATQQQSLRSRMEQNHDQTNTWGLHLAYMRPLAAPGWRIGWLATVNRMSHPKLPEYQLANVPVIPRDPGRSSAFNVGIGVAKTRGPLTFGIDAIYEPAWSYTWADAASPEVTAAGDTIPVGGKTVENHFRFSDGQLRMGVSRDLELGPFGKAAGLQLGLIVRSVHYRLAQDENVQAMHRTLDEGWLEWTPTWGLSLRLPDVEIRYRGRVTRGTGRPGVQQPVGVWADRATAFAGSSILVAPSGPLSLQEVSTTTHQISLSLPLR